MGEDTSRLTGRGSRRDLSEDRTALLHTGLSFVRRARTFQTSINIACVFGGGALGAIGGAMEGGLIPSSGDGFLTAKGICVWLGVGLVLLGGVLLHFIADEAPELLRKALALEGKAQAFLDEREALIDRLESLAALDRKRLALIEANKVMRETLEQSLLVPEADPAGTAQLMLDAALRFITTSIGFDPDEQWAISVFRVESEGDIEELRRIACRRADRLAEQNNPRGWKRNEGFVGTAWATEQAVIVTDGTMPDALDQYRVPAPKQRDYDPERYRSMAAIPVRLGDPARIWGVIAASTDCAGRFRRDPGNKQVQAVDTVRLIARMTGLMAAAFERSDR